MYFTFIADTVDGQILEFPQTFDIRCGQETIVGRQVVRQFDGNECIKARNVFLIWYRGQLLGSVAFKTVNEFISYQNSNCQKRGTCLLTINSCYALINGCGINS